jgi:uncharacterized protein (TIGR03067 family)
MRSVSLGLLVVLTAMAAIASAEDSKDEAIKKVRKQIEGTWRIVALEIDGNKANEEYVRKFTVITSYDGTWSLRSNDKEITKGTSTFDPTKTPKTIEFTPTDRDGQADQYLGIFEIGENTRKLCFAPPGKERPTEFSSKPDSQHILVTFEREMPM